MLWGLTASQNGPTPDVVLNTPCNQVHKAGHSGPKRDTQKLDVVYFCGLCVHVQTPCMAYTHSRMYLFITTSQVDLHALGAVTLIAAGHA